MYKILVDGQLFCSSKIQELAIINPVIKLEANSAGTFSFTMPPQHPYYSLIQKRMSLIDVYRDSDTEPVFEGICVSDDVDFYKQKKITCEGDLTFLNDSNLRPSHKQDLTSRQLLEAYINEHNSLVEPFKRFTVGQVTARDTNDSITCYTNYNSTMEEIKKDLVDDIGGYLRVRHVNGVRYLDYLADSPRTNNQVIRLGENLIDMSVGLDTDDLATVIVPLGETLDTQTIEGLDDRLTIKNTPADAMHPQGADYVYSADAVATFGRIEKVVEWNDVTVATNLLAKAKKYLQETQFENLVIEAKAFDLGLTTDAFQKLKILDEVRVVSRPHGLDRYFMLSAMEIHLNKPESDTITLGSKEANTLSAKSASANAEIMKRIEQVPTSNAVKSAIENATALITGAEGGYVVIERNAQGQPIEIKIQNALNNPTKIWRWNINGLGYSNNSGRTYGTAITMDGSIVASYITSGTMTADRIRGGELLVGGSGLGANGQITIRDSSNRVLITINTYGLTLYDTSGNAKAYMDSNGLTISKGTINGAVINAGGTMDGAINIYDANGNRVGRWDGDGFDVSNRIIFNTPAFRVDSSGSIYGHGDLTMDGGLGISGYSDLNGVHVHEGLMVDGEKSRIVQTKDFGYQLLHAYETPTPYFGDIGEGKTDSEGECVIVFDDIFHETIDSDCRYQVFLQAYDEGQVYIKERTTNHFVVKGTPNLEFGWELKAVQKDYNGMRFKEVDSTIIDSMERSKQA